MKFCSYLLEVWANVEKILEMGDMIKGCDPCYPFIQKFSRFINVNDRHDPRDRGHAFHGREIRDQHDLH